ncbi:MAG: hypothetical protein IPG45_05380 [Deltaproteobacteria bacterium]|nr:hypothetical protein [Deltaproteobacteria bacterium]
MNTKKMSALEIRRRALRAAGQVALWSTLACGGEAVTTGLPDYVAPSGPNDEPATELMAVALPQGVVVQQVETTTIARVVCDADVQDEEAWERYLECCQQIGWDWDRGCAAWGPPVPPSLEVVA